MRIRVHIHNESMYMHEDVFVDVELCAVPRVGENVFLGQKHLEEIESKARADTYMASLYAPRFFYGKSNGVEFVGQKNLKDLSFSDAINVVDVAYNTEDGLIEIELG